MAKAKKNGSGLKHGEGTIVERPLANGTSSWQHRFVDRLPNGRVQRSAVTYATREAAEDAARALYRKRQSGAYVAPEQRTVKELIEEWIERGKLAWSSNTIYTRSSLAAGHIYPALGDIRITALTPPRVQHWIDSLTRKGLSASSIRSAHEIVAGAFREAVRLGVLPTTPTLGVRLPVPKPKTIPTWTEEEVRRISDATAHEPLWNALYLLGGCTGMRPGELRALRWSDLDLDQRIVHIRRTATRDEDGNDIIGEYTKTRQPRDNSISRRAVAALHEWKLAQAELRRTAPIWQLGDYVFSTDGGFLTRYRWGKEHTRICAKAGVRPITRHQGIRHTNGTLELKAGTPIKIVAARLGHTRPEFTARLYQHVTDDIAQDAVDALDERLFGTTTSDQNTGENA